MAPNHNADVCTSTGAYTSCPICQEHVPVSDFRPTGQSRRRVARDPGVLDAINQADRIGDHATANLLRREAAATDTTASDYEHGEWEPKAPASEVNL